MEIGARVRWTSQSQASSKTKEGIIAEVIPAGVRPSPSKWPSLYTGAGPGSARNHESYIVRVGSKVYWPRVSKLVLIDTPVVGQSKPTWVPPTDLDPECLDLCVAMNKLPGVRTTESCCGHADDLSRPYSGPYMIFFMVDSLEALPPLLYYTDACHSGCVGWRVIVYTDCSMAPARFMLEGPKGKQAYQDSKEIAKCIEGYVTNGC